jgi:hypothetical protein
MPDDKIVALRLIMVFWSLLRISYTLRGVITICRDRQSHFLASTTHRVLYRGRKKFRWRRFILDRSIDDKREAKQACNKEIANSTMVIYALLY